MNVGRIITLGKHIIQPASPKPAICHGDYITSSVQLTGITNSTHIPFLLCNLCFTIETGEQKIEQTICLL